MAITGSILNWIERSLLAWINVDRYLPLQLDITNLCNLRCIHCYHPHHNNEGALSLSEWLEIISQYEKLVSRLKFRPYIILCGGEPLVSPFLYLILKNILDKNLAYRLSILTNGILTQTIDHTIFKRFEKIEFQISLDGPNAFFHDQIRGIGSFEKTSKGVSYLIEKGYQVNLLCVLSKNSSNYISDYFEVAKKWNVNQRKSFSF
jgi:MoaA/NifB/PqqE/SkfB family radical SAM enzyme